jgi:hypothetical protein
MKRQTMVLTATFLLMTLFMISVTSSVHAQKQPMEPQNPQGTSETTRINGAPGATGTPGTPGSSGTTGTATPLPKTASATEGNSPDLFQLEHNDLHISYSTSSISGQPLFNYRDAQQEQSFRGDEIRVQESELGTLVTVSVKKTVDTGYTSLTLILPKVKLGNAQKQAINALALEVQHLLGLLPVTGGLDKYQHVYHLHGSASLVLF